MFPLPMDSILDKKFILNIKLEGKFSSYATVAKRLLTDDKAPQIQLSTCGAAILYLLKVSSILTEYLPGLHKISYITYSQCHTCQNKRQKYGHDGFLEKEQVIDQFRDKIGRASIVHHCKDPESFPILLTFNQRISFRDDLWDTKHPGYQRPQVIPHCQMTFFKLVEMFNT